MESWIEFALERYNYWIVIILMMTGLYIVFARGNLVKKVVGLNVFQTSVFIFYITIGKSAGGTAPIFIGDAYKDRQGYGGKGHGEEGGDAADGAHGGEAHELQGGGLHDKVENLPANDLTAALGDPGAAGDAADAPSLHGAPADIADKVSNDALAAAAKSGEGFEVAGDAAKGAADAAGGLAEVIYTNPLPHVLILTAIVVGVATTAVGLALAVRIREAYGTIEEDELDALDHVAEFGAEPAAAEGGAA